MSQFSTEKSSTMRHKNWEWLDVARRKAAWPWVKHDTPAGAEIDIKWEINKLCKEEKAKKQRKDSASGQYLNSGLPKVVPGGTLRMTVWQVNQDGGGPFKCKIDYKGTAQSWTSEGLKVETNCQGNAHSIRSWGGPSACSLTVHLPSNLNCAGKYDTDRICIVRCENFAVNGPFGGCVAVQQLKPVVKQVVQKKPVPVPVVKPAKPVVLPPKAITVTKNNVITVIKGGQTRVSVITKNNVLTVTQVVKPRPETTVETSIRTVTVETKVYPTKDASSVEEPIEPTARPPTDEKPTDEELEAGLGGEHYDEDVLEELKDTPITSEEKEKLGEQVGQVDEASGYYKRKLRFHRD
ncbi:hypothetical protein TWF281_010881 [Arthrobotrys megalospora]